MKAARPRRKNGPPTKSGNQPAAAARAPVRTPGARHVQDLQGLQESHGNSFISEQLHSSSEQASTPFGAGAVVLNAVAAQLHDEPTSEIHDAAELGTQGSGHSLPYLSQIQSSFGRHHVTGVQAYTGSKATSASEAMGAEAYATGSKVAFGGTPTMHTAAHEAAHIVQQRAGVSLKGGVGAAGDQYEQHADAVADMVVQGKSAEPLLDQMAPSGSSGASVQKHVQRYAKVSGKPYDRLSDDGKLAVVDHGKVGWAESANLNNTNVILKAQNSKAQVKETGGTIKVKPPGRSSPERTLSQFRMEEEASAGTELDLVDDCGTANQQLMGAKTAGSWSFVAANKRGTTQEFTGESAYQGDDRAPGGTVSTTEKLSGQIYIRIFEREFGKKLNRTDALKEWGKLSASKKRSLSRKYGINEFAKPKVGQGITIGSERDIPGAAGGGYNFHFGLNLVESGHDYITLEDYDSSGVKYYLDMYGPESKGQAWAQDSGNTGAMGGETTTMVVVHPEMTKGEVNAEVKIVDDPATGANPVKLLLGTGVQILRHGRTHMKIKVLAGPEAGKEGWMLNKFFIDT